MKRCSNKCLTIYLTEKCNLNCKYCFVKKSNKKLNVEDYISVIEKYKDEILNITFFGGEPLLCFDLIKFIVDYNVNKNYLFTYILNTNGLLLNNEMLDFIEKNNILVNLSLDGNNISNNVNRGNIFDDVFDRIKKLEQRKIDYIINYVISPNNICYFYDSISFFKNEKISKICLMINYDARWSLDDISFFKEQLNKSFSIILNNNGLMKIYPIYNKLSALLNNTEVKKCDFGNDSIVLSVSGKIYPCIGFCGEKEFEINDKCQLFCNTVSTVKCSDCEYKNYCKNNCMCRSKSVFLNNDLDVNCEFEKIFIDFSKKIVEGMLNHDEN